MGGQSGGRVVQDKAGKPGPKELWGVLSNRRYGEATIAYAADLARERLLPLRDSA